MPLKTKEGACKTYWFTQVMFQDIDCNRIDFTLSNAFTSKTSVSRMDRLRWSISPKIKYFHHINYGVIQGFPALGKAVTTHVKKYNTFSRVFNIANGLLTHHSPFAPLGQVYKWTAKPSPFSIQGGLSESFGLWLLKNPKVLVAYRQWHSNSPRRERKPKYEKKKRKLGIQWLW